MPSLLKRISIIAGILIAADGLSEPGISRRVRPIVRREAIAASVAILHLPDKKKDGNKSVFLFYSSALKSILLNQLKLKKSEAIGVISLPQGRLRSNRSNPSSRFLIARHSLMLRQS